VLAAKRDQLLASPVRRQRANAPARKKSPATVRRYLAALSHAFSVAMREWGWLEDNPFLKITKPPESRGRTRYLDRRELARLLEACQSSKNPHLYAMTVLGVSTGMRLGEMAWLRRKDIDCDKAQIVLERSKNNDPRVVPLAGRALALLKARLGRPGKPHELVFPGRNPEKPSEIAEAWNNARKRAGITNFRFHDLRHSAAAFLVDGGATDLQIAAVLGHRTLQMVKRYAHVRQAIAAKVVAEMNERIFSEA
jgi:integrase